MNCGRVRIEFARATAGHRLSVTTGPAEPDATLPVRWPSEIGTALHLPDTIPRFLGQLQDESRYTYVAPTLMSPGTDMTCL